MLTLLQLRPHQRLLAVLAATIVVAGTAGAGLAADLPTYGPVPPPTRYGIVEAVPDDTRPASSHGYYGYYGYDIAGVPYGGLYSESSVCLRSVRTPDGYKTVDACRR